MNKINKQLNLLLKYIGEVCSIIVLLKLNMILYVVFLPDIWKKQKRIIFILMNIKLRLSFPNKNKLKVNLKPNT